MLVHKCDKCKKEIKQREDMVNVYLNDTFQTLSFCKPCAVPITNFLKKEKLLKSKEIKVVPKRKHVRLKKRVVMLEARAHR